MQAQNTALRATQILMAEHEVILGVLDCLEKLASDASASGTIEPRSARDILDFLATFADGCHHKKEEDCLFPSLVRKGMPRQVGPVAVMLAEHELGRAEVAAMKAALSDGARDPAAVARFAEHARAYVELLREHIAKENGVLFPMADGMFGDEDQAALLDAFRNVEHHSAGEGTHERYLALARDLVQRLDVKRTHDAFPATGACCGHGTCHGSG